eukprot:m.46604 g.46604  ORF g.46604 m.46604 type:complete len:504 (+) comp20292_c1_seq1:233-1744(+)
MVELDSTMVICTSFAFAAILLITGHFLRARLWLFRRLFLPSSLIGGLLGLTIVQVLEAIPGINYQVERNGINVTASFVSEQLIAGWSELPAVLIAVVFSCLFMGSKIPGIRKVWNIAGPQLIYGQIVAWGQYAIPMLIVGALFSREDVFGSNPLLGAVVALGFEGGHGTAAAVSDTFDRLGYPEGKDLALCAATIGLLSGLLYGTVLMNWAVAQGFVIKELEDIGIQGKRRDLFSGVFAKQDRPSAGKQTVSVDSLDSFALHISFVGAALLFGTLVKRVLSELQTTNEFLEETEFFDAFPIFPFTMFGGILIQISADRFAPEGYIDRETMDRISGLALDFTIVTAITTMQLDSLADEILPFLILVFVAWGWHLLCFFVIARRILPDFWVERALAELGQSMGVTATGLLLLRMCDPKNKTPALQAFSYKQLIHEPIVGGGLWTALVLPYIKNVGIWPATGTAWGALVLCFILFFVFFRKTKSVDLTSESNASHSETTPILKVAG